MTYAFTVTFRVSWHHGADYRHARLAYYVVIDEDDKFLAIAKSCAEISPLGVTVDGVVEVKGEIR